MTDRDKLLSRIADAVERIAPPRVEPADWTAHPAYVWNEGSARGIAAIDAPPLALLRGIDAQKERVVANVSRHAEGYAAHDMLLWGSRGMGKSALIRSAVFSAQSNDPSRIALVQVSQDALAGMVGLFSQLAGIDRRFLVYIDDLGFEDDDGSSPRQLRSWLEGGVEARPTNVRLAVTSNRRAIVARHLSEQDDPVNPRDTLDDKLALADRFGMSLGFHNCDQTDYLDIVAGYATEHGLSWEESDALEWSKRRGARSGRVAWQYVVELAGRAGRAI